MDKKRINKNMEETFKNNEIVTQTTRCGDIAEGELVLLKCSDEEDVDTDEGYEVVSKEGDRCSCATFRKATLEDIIKNQETWQTLKENSYH
jgi:hypothetical protein